MRVTDHERRVIVAFSQCNQLQQFFILVLAKLSCNFFKCIFDFGIKTFQSQKSSFYVFKVLLLWSASYISRNLDDFSTLVLK